MPAMLLPPGPSSKTRPYLRPTTLTYALMYSLLQGSNARQNRYEQARDFVPPGRLMFLRPIKSAAKERKSNRKYMPVWITAQVCSLCSYTVITVVTL